MVNGMYLDNVGYYGYFRDGLDRGMVYEEGGWWRSETQVSAFNAEPPCCGYDRLILPEEYLL
jgi:hypothetical protein|tara:strand:+ start:145 stop:330 length:186 start_codon:yes stop_codon:yes gene_type:complete